MQTEFQTRLLTQSDCYQAGRTIVPRGVMVHSTRVAQPDPEVFLRRWDRPGVDACVHAFVAEDPGDPDPALELAGLARWGEGSGAAPTTPTSPLSAVNRRDTPTREERWWAMTRRLQRPYFERIYQNAAALCARLCGCTDWIPGSRGW